MMRGRNRGTIDEVAVDGNFSLCGSRISISLSTIQEECSAYDYFSSQSSFGTVSSFDSAMISAESLCSGCRFESVVAKAGAASKNKAISSKLMPSIIRPTEIIFEGLDEMEQNNPANNNNNTSNLIQNARRPLRSSIGSCGSGDSSSHHSIYGDCGAEYTKPLNDDDNGGPLEDDDSPEYSRPLNDEYDTDSGWEYSRPLNDDPSQRYHRYSSNHHRYNEEEKVEEGHDYHSSSGADWIRQFDDMRLIASSTSPMPSPASSCSSKSRSRVLAIPTAMVDTILSNPDSLRALED